MPLLAHSRPSLALRPQLLAQDLHWLYTLTCCVSKLSILLHAWWQLVFIDFYTFHTFKQYILTRTTCFVARGLVNLRLRNSLCFVPFSYIMAQDPLWLTPSLVSSRPSLALRLNLLCGSRLSLLYALTCGLNALSGTAFTYYALTSNTRFM